MNYGLDSYASFEEEQELLKAEAMKKEQEERQKEIELREIEFRLNSIRGYFLRLSWQHKKEFIISMVDGINCFDTLLRIIGYISTLHGKMAAYTDVSSHCKIASQQIMVDHDRCLDSESFEGIAPLDLNWITTLPKPQQIHFMLSLLHVGGGGLMRKIYVPIVNIYNKKVKQDMELKSQHLPSLWELTDIFDEPEPDDSDKYPRDHHLTLEVERLRKKWDETIDKGRREIFGFNKEPSSEKLPKRKPEKGKKGGKTDKEDGDTTDWIQMLPIWIVKKILNHFDLKTLQGLKKVNQYWAYACDSLIKDREGRHFLDAAIQKMAANIDPDILAECREGIAQDVPKRPDNPREKRLNKLLNRGAILETMKPKVKKSNETRTCLVTSIRKGYGIFDPLDKVWAFPRLIKEDLLLYKKYPCILKDVNILINVDDSLMEQRNTLSYTLSQELSDTFSLSEANLANW